MIGSVPKITKQTSKSRIESVVSPLREKKLGQYDDPAIFTTGFLDLKRLDN